VFGVLNAAMSDSFFVHEKTSQCRQISLIAARSILPLRRPRPGAAVPASRAPPHRAGRIITPIL